MLDACDMFHWCSGRFSSPVAEPACPWPCMSQAIFDVNNKKTSHSSSVEKNLAQEITTFNFLKKYSCFWSFFPPGWRYLVTRTSSCHLRHLSSTDVHLSVCLCLLVSKINSQLLGFDEVEQWVVHCIPLCRIVEFHQIWTLCVRNLKLSMMIVSSAYFYNISVILGTAVVGVQSKQQLSREPWRALVLTIRVEKVWLPTCTVWICLCLSITLRWLWITR